MRGVVRTAVVGVTAALAVGMLAGPAAAKGQAVGGRGDQYFLNDAFDGMANQVFGYGDPGDVVLFGDWDGNGTDTPMIRRGNTFYVRNTNTSGPAETVFSYGDPGDAILVGDWDGNGTDTLTVRRGSTFYVKNSVSTGMADVVFSYGEPRDTVLVGDWDGNRSDTLAVRRGNQYFVKNALTSGVADTTFAYGDPGDTVLVGHWAAGQVGDSLGVRRGATYYLRNSLTSGPADRVFGYGDPTDTAFVGDWDGNGVDSLGVRRPYQGGNQLNIGQTYYGQGFRYTVSTLSPYTPSVSAVPAGIQRAVTVTLTLENTGATPIGPYDWGIMGSVGGLQVDFVSDPSNGLSDGPTADLLPGQRASYVVGFSVPPAGGVFLLDTFLRNEDIRHAGPLR